MIAAFLATDFADPNHYEKYAAVSGYRVNLGFYLVCH